MGHSFLRRYGSERWSFTIRFFITAVLDSTKLQAEVDSVTNDEVVKPVVTGSGAPGTDVNISFTPATVFGSNGAEVDIAWFIVAFAAGNPVLSDSDAASIDDLGADGVAGGGDDGLQLLDVDEPHILRVDKLAPSFVANGLLTGRFFDTGTSTVKTNDQTSIEVRFSEKLNVSSVSATDFTVDGLTPLNAQAFSALETSVFLTLATPMVADAQPQVGLVSGVADKAGNTKTAIAPTTALDKIAPSFVVTRDRTVTDDQLILSLSNHTSGVKCQLILVDNNMERSTNRY